MIRTTRRRTNRKSNAAVLLTLCLVWLPCLALGQAVPAPQQPTFTDEHAQAVLETDPTTPFELVRAVEVLIDLRQAAAARPLVERLQAANLDDRALFELMETFGPATFLKIARAEALAPQGRQFADQVRSAATSYARDPARIDDLIAQLGGDSPAVRNEAINALSALSSTVVTDLLRVLADDTETTTQQAAAWTLARIGPGAIGPLTGALQADDERLAAQAATMLARLRSDATLHRLLALSYADDTRTAEAARQAIVALLGQLPSQPQTATLLEKQARDYLAGRSDLPRGRRLPDDPALAQVIDLWFWDAELQTSVAVPVGTQQARRLLAAEAAAAALRLTPVDDPNYPARRRLYVSTALETMPAEIDLAQLVTLFPQPLQPRLASDGPLLLDVLDEALRYGLAQGAQRASELLGQMRPGPWFATGSEPNALVRALSHPDRQVRFAALAAVMRLKPAGRFPGSSQLPIAVAYFLASTGGPKAVSAASSVEEAGRLAGLASALGYDIEVATDGATLLDSATSTGDVELILLDSTLLAPRPIDMLSLLRNDPRTAGLPIALVIVPGEEDYYARTLRRDPLTGSIIRPHSAAALQFQLSQLWQESGYRPPSGQDRQSQAAAALDWALQLTETGERVFNLERLITPLSAALFDARFGEPAARALAQIGRPEAQRTLVDFASQNLLVLESRQAASAAFCDSVGRWGILLTSDQMLLQYDRYNASEHLDRPTQVLLSSILDCLELGRAPAAATP